MGQKLDIKCKLTLRICLKFHMKIFNPLGLVLPTRMWRNLLFRCTLQIIETAERDRIPWDEKLHSNLVADWFTYFDMLKVLQNIRFPRSFKPRDVDNFILPILVTMSDGYPNAFICLFVCIMDIEGFLKNCSSYNCKRKVMIH